MNIIQLLNLRYIKDSIPVLFFLIWGMGTLSAQMDTKHYIPPLYAREDPGYHTLFISTTVSTPFNVTVTDGAGNLIATLPVSNTAPNSYDLGAGTDSPFLISENELNSPISTNKGLILTADQPFIANVRILAFDVGSQGASLTSKGAKAALGTDFRTGHMYNNNYDSHKKSNVFSFMATEDNTTVLISDISEGVVFRNTTASGFPLTSSDITVQLDAGESYVVAAFLDEAGASNNVNGVNGTHITSDKNIVLNSGTWLGGNPIYGTSPTGTPASGRDIGIDQFVPKDVIGSEYILIKGSGVDNERTIVIASEDNTDIFMNGSATPVATIANAGDFYVFDGTVFSVDNNLYLQSSAPVYVVQSLNGGDPYLWDNERQNGINFIPPVTCNGTRHVVIPQIEFLGEPFLNIIARAGASVEINNNVLTGAQPVPGTTEYVTYQVQGYTGNISITSDNVVLVALLNLDAAVGSAGYFSGFSKEFEIAATFMDDNVINNGNVYEGCGTVEITLVRSILNESVPEIVSLSISGTAEEDVDYSSFPTEVTIPAGETEVSFTVDIYNDGISEALEDLTISATIAGNACAEDVITFYINDVDELAGILPADTTICSGQSLLLHPIVTGGVQPYTYDWSTGSTASEIIIQPQNNVNYTVSVASACATGDDTVELSTLVEVMDVELTLSENVSICSGSSTTLTASTNISGATIIWQPGGLQGESITVSPTSSVAYTAIATSPQNCNSSPATVFVSVTPGAEISISGNDSICAGESTTLTASSETDLIYSWNPGNFSESAITVSPAETTSYTVEGQSDTGCGGSQEFVVVVNTPELSIAGDSIICIGDSATLTVSSDFADFQFVWEPLNLEGDEITVNPTENTTYTIQASSETGCAAVTEVEVEVKQLPVVDITGDAFICAGARADLTASSTSPGVNFEWNTAQNTQDISVYPDTTTQYSVTGFDGLCTSEPEFFTVSVQPIPLLYAPEDTLICPGSIELFAGSDQNAAQFFWEPGGLSGNSVTLSPETATTYMVVAEVNDCSSQPALFTIDLLQSCSCEFEMVNIFTPNGDNRNEFFERAGGDECDFVSYEINVFNRWGKLIWSNSDPDQFWDGKSKDQIVSDGTYFWELRYRFVGNDDFQRKSGYVVITQ